MCMHSAVDVAWFSASWMRLCIAKLHVAGSHRHLLTTSDEMACLIDSPGVGRRPIHKGIERVYLRLFLPQSTSWVYIFIIKYFELGSQTRDQSDHLALAFFLVYKLTVLCVCVCV